MSPRQRILSIKLAEKINKNPAYAQHLGLKIKTQKRDK